MTFAATTAPVGPIEAETTTLPSIPMVRAVGGYTGATADIGFGGLTSPPGLTGGPGAVGGGGFISDTAEIPCRSPLGDAEPPSTEGAGSASPEAERAAETGCEVSVADMSGTRLGVF